MGNKQRQVRPLATAAQMVLLPLVLLLCCTTQQASAAAPLKIAIVNQVHFHLEVVAGAMHVLKPLTSGPVTVFLPAKVLKTNWYGFRNWLADKEGFEWKECKEYDGTTTYDLVLFISPEYHTSWVAQVTEQMKPKVALYYVHNGHIPDAEFNKIKALSPKFPLVTLSPHVAKNISTRAAPVEPQWVLPIFPYTPASVCSLADIQVCSNQVAVSLQRVMCCHSFTTAGDVSGSAGSDNSKQNRSAVLAVASSNRCSLQEQQLYA
jgi:hypothetical protein